MAKVESVEDYIEQHPNFSEALVVLRELLSATELMETIKWSAPVYTLDGKNILGLGAFKNYFCIWFFNGVFLKDEQKRLMQAQEKTKALRQMRFTSLQDIHKPLILAYIKEAIDNHNSGKEWHSERNKNTVTIPVLLKVAFKTDAELKKSFSQLTLGKQREYAEHIASAQRDATKIYTFKYCDTHDYKRYWASR